ncbi:sodium-dependent bicarbonate transport family permease [Cryobacterium tagatosivorans]|uniref:sodium-dependent bicarbonate transport family permease n=1 Tax=Cryobacterium tagatosivorans TaxID=1259199 RepID=UPI001F53F495|nr:sodium-dependent bicarbonate transport family permease [Cryobacterium tagatosivorans]
MSSIEPGVFDLLKGVLALFLMKMGLITAKQVGSLLRHGPFLSAFALGCRSSRHWSAPGWDGSAASASNIAAPAAMRFSVPEVNPTLSLAAALGITFPFDVLLGIPISHALAARFRAQHYHDYAMILSASDIAVLRPQKF